MQSDQFNANPAATGMAAPSELVDDRPAIEPATTPLNILLVEDGYLNQRFAQVLLSKWRHKVTVADNGREAVARVVSEAAFDVILMDIHMPEMDGYQATAEIRQQETKAGGHIPIVAMTADALESDSAEWLAAGFDDYVSKPIDREQLRAALQRIAGQQPVPPAIDRPLQATRPLEQAQVYDEQAVLDRIEGDVEFLKQMMRIFLRESESMVDGLRKSIESGDAGELRRIAHTLKSSAAGFYATAVANTAATLEQVAIDEHLDQAPELLAQLERQLEPLCAAFRQRWG